MQIYVIMKSLINTNIPFLISKISELRNIFFFSKIFELVFGIETYNDLI